MKNLTLSFGLLILSLLVIVSCTRVAPNYFGVLMENYGKSGKGDYSRVSGKVNDWGPGTELFQVPAWEQRADFSDNDDKQLKLKAGDNTEFTAKPLYSYRAIESKVVDLVFQNARLGSGEEFMKKLENNILEPRIYDIIKEESRKYTTDTLMAQGGSLLFEQRVQTIVKAEFEKSGLELMTFSSNLDFSNKVKEKIDARNEVNTNLSVLDQQIAEQKKKNELEELKAQQNIIRSRGITPQILDEQAIQKWDGKLPNTVAGDKLPFIKSVN